MARFQIEIGKHQSTELSVKINTEIDLHSSISAYSQKDGYDYTINLNLYPSLLCYCKKKTIKQSKYSPTLARKKPEQRHRVAVVVCPT